MKKTTLTNLCMNLKSDGKVTAKSAPFQIFRRILPRLVATAAPIGDKQPSQPPFPSQDADY